MGMVAIVLVFWALLPDTFMTARNWLNITQQVSMLTVVAVAMTVVMVVGDFDLSVGSMASLSGIVAAVLFTLGWPVPVAVGAALAVGLAGGLINGVLVSVIGILPFVATLATLTMYSGLPLSCRVARRSLAAIFPNPSLISPNRAFPWAAWATSL
jgi:ribose transport system permease protein